MGKKRREAEGLIQDPEKGLLRLYQKMLCNFGVVPETLDRQDMELFLMVQFVDDEDVLADPGNYDFV